MRAAGCLTATTTLGRMPAADREGHLPRLPTRSSCSALSALPTGTGASLRRQSSQRIRVYLHRAGACKRTLANRATTSAPPTATTQTRQRSRPRATSLRRSPRQRSTPPSSTRGRRAERPTSDSPRGAQSGGGLRRRGTPVAGPTRSRREGRDLRTARGAGLLADGPPTAIQNKACAGADRARPFPP